MCLQSVWLWNNYDKTTGMFPKNQCQFTPRPPHLLNFIFVEVKNGGSWASATRREAPSHSRVLLWISCTSFLPLPSYPTHRIWRHHTLDEPLRTDRAHRLPTFDDRVRIIMLHLWRHKRLNRPETACDLTTSHTPRLKNAGQAWTETSLTSSNTLGSTEVKIIDFNDS